MVEERFEWINGYEYHYIVSTQGAVISFPRRDKYGRFHESKVLPQRLSKQGYPIVDLNKDGVATTRAVHRLVAETFIPNPENKPCIDHINTIKTDNRVANLRWASYRENMNNPITREQMLSDTSKFVSQRGEDNPFSQPVQRYTLGGMLIETYPSIGEAIRKTGVSYNVIHRCASGRTKSGKGFVWKHVGKPSQKLHKGTFNVQGKPILQLTKEGKLVAEYNSISAAAKATGFSPENIGRAVKGIKSKSYKGFLWVLKEDCTEFGGE